MRFRFFLFLFLWIIGNLSGVPAQAQDFFSNTQSSGQLASSASGCPTGATCTTNGPGFNPTDLVNHADPNSTITGAPKVVGGIRPFFSQLGPGAITDNLFGVLSQVHPGADAIVNNADDDPRICGLLPGDPNTGAGVPPTSVGSNNSSLNCGDLRFDPASQGQTIPTQPATNNVTFNLNPVTVGLFNSDFNPSTSDHLGLDLVNDFTFILSPTSASGTQQMKQVTALTAGANITGCAPATPPSSTLTSGCPGTLASPGTGDQLLDIDTSWSLTGTFNSATNRPTITWSMTLDDIDPLTPSSLITNQTDSINTMGTLTMTGFSFEYNSGTFPQTTIPLPCWWSGCTLTTTSATIP